MTASIRLPLSQALACMMQRTLVSVIVVEQYKVVWKGYACIDFWLYFYNKIKGVRMVGMRETRSDIYILDSILRCSIRSHG